MTTFVTALLTGINSFRDVSKYVEYGSRLLEVKSIQKVVFMERAVYDKYGFAERGFENIRFIFIQISDLYLYEQLENITEFGVDSTNPHKDTVEYMMVQCHKTEWVKQATDLDHFSSSHFVWIDFGICNMLGEITENQLGKYLGKLGYNFGGIDGDNETVKPIVRIGGCWDAGAHYLVDLNRQISWYFAGSLFGGNRTGILRFAELMKCRCFNYILERKSLVWEVNLWRMVYLENKELFSVYSCNHNLSILEGY